MVHRFYSVNRGEYYKIRQRYAHGEGNDAKIHVIIIYDCNMEPQYTRVLRAIYLKQDAGIVDRLLKELDDVRTNYKECENRNQELLELVETLRSDLTDAKQRIEDIIRCKICFFVFGGNDVTMSSYLHVH